MEAKNESGQNRYPKFDAAKKQNTRPAGLSEPGRRPVPVYLSRHLFVGIGIADQIYSRHINKTWTISQGKTLNNLY